MSIEAAIASLQAKALALDGMKSAPDAPPESPGAFPFAVSYERQGNLLLRSGGFADDLATIWTEIHVARQILPRAVEAAMAFRDPFLKAILADPTLGGSVSTVTAVRRTFGKLEWADTPTLGYRIEIDIKVQLTV